MTTATTRSGWRSSVTPLRRTGARVPSGRTYSFSYGATQPSASSLRVTWSSCAAHSGAVIARQLISPASSSSRVRPTIASHASLDSRTRSSSEMVTPTTLASTSRRNRRSSSAVGPEDAIASVSQAGTDVAVAVELAVERGREDRHLGMRAVQRPDALRRRDEAHERDPLRARALHPGDRLGRAAAGCQHRIDHEDLGIGHAGRDVLVVADRAQRLLVAVH